MQSYREIKTDLQHLKAGAGTIVEKNEKPGRGAAVAGYFNSGAVSLRFIFGEKENIVFAFLQWAVIGIAYYLWVQALALVPEDVWQSGDGRRQCRQPCSADVVFCLCRFGRLSSWFVDGLHERIVYSAFYGQGVDGGGMPENSVAKILESVGVQLVGRLVDGYAYFGTFAKEKRSHAVGGQTGK